LIDASGVVTADEITVGGVDLLHAKPAMRRKIVGKEIAMIFQDALTSLNPSLTIGYQIREILVQHTNLRGAALDARILELLDQVRIADAKKRRDAYPHELSGGMTRRTPWSPLLIRPTF
jgi:dipeptide transport system ATP-binding protein